MADPNLDEPREWVGSWWLPDSEARVIPGILRWEPEVGLRLQLIGGFDTFKRWPDENGGLTIGGQIDSWDLIHGVAEGTPITLRDTRTLKTSGVDLMGGVGSQVLAAGSAMVGIHQQSEACVGAVTVSVERLHEWAVANGVTTPWKLDDEGKTPTGEASVTIEPLPTRVAVVDDVTVRLVYSHTLPQPLVGKRGVSGEIRQWATMTFEFETLRAVDDVLPYVSNARDIAALSTMSRCGVIWVTLQVRLDGKVDHKYPTRAQHDRVEFYWRSPALPTPESGPRRRSFDTLFSLLDVDYEAFLTTWLRSSRLRAPRSMVLGALETSGGYLEPEVLTAISAAEVLHRAISDEPNMPEDDFLEIRSRLLSEVPKKRRKWLEGLLSRNEPNLPKRLHALAKRLDQEVRAAILPNVAVWVDTATAVRNEIAHQGRADGRDPRQIFAIAEVTRAVAVLVLLMELGVSSDRIKYLVEHHAYFVKARAQGEHLVLPALETPTD